MTSSQFRDRLVAVSKENPDYLFSWRLVRGAAAASASFATAQSGQYQILIRHRTGVEAGIKIDCDCDDFETRLNEMLHDALVVMVSADVEATDMPVKINGGNN